MKQPETYQTIETSSQIKAIWGSLTADQQKMVLQTMVWICCQVIEQRMQEKTNETAAE